MDEETHLKVKGSWFRILHKAKAKTGVGFYLFADKTGSLKLWPKADRRIQGTAKRGAAMILTALIALFLGACRD
jgi:hypothetical protein